MATNTTKREIAIYVHPDHGPIMPMMLDLMEVELAALKVPEARRDDTRAREIAQKIKKKFPKVDPESNWQQIASLPGRFSHYTIFNAVVLRLPGTIEADKPPPAEPSQAILDQLKQINKETQQLKGELLKEHGEHAKTREQRAALEGRYKQVLALYDKVKAQLDDAQNQAQQFQQRYERARDVVKQYRAALDASEKKVGALELELEQAKQSVADLDESVKQQMSGLNELSELRQYVLNAEKGEQQLRATIAVREKQIQDLSKHLQRLTEGDEAWESNTPEDDPFSGL